MLARKSALAPPGSRLLASRGLQATDIRKALVRFTATDRSKTSGSHSLGSKG